MAANAITLSGNVVEDPELAATPTGRFVLSFRIAVDEAGNNGGESGFFNCVAWRDLAENLAETLKKGQRVIVTGKLQHRTWKDEGGNKRSSIELVVDDAGPSMMWATASVTKRVRSQAPAEAEAAPQAEPQPA